MLYFKKKPDRPVIVHIGNFYRQLTKTKKSDYFINLNKNVDS